MRKLITASKEGGGFYTPIGGARLTALRSELGRAKNWQVSRYLELCQYFTEKWSHHPHVQSAFSIRKEAAHAELERRNRIEFERRASSRYAISLNLHYEGVAGGRPLQGSGQTVNLSVDGLLFRPSEPIPVGSDLEIRVEWPVDHAPGAHSILAIRGVAVCISEEGCGVAIQQHHMEQAQPLEPLA